MKITLVSMMGGYGHLSSGPTLEYCSFYQRLNRYKQACEQLGLGNA